MDSADLQDVTVGSGPGTRGETCDICIEVINFSDETVTHNTCENTFHKACFDERANSNSSRRASATCPKCRARLSRPETTSVWHHFHALQASNEGSPTTGQSDVRARPLTTVQADMYDYSMQINSVQDGLPTPEFFGFPTPALFHHIETNRPQAIEWVSDYFTRLAQAQNLSSEEFIAHVVRYYLMMEQVPQATILQETHVINDEVEEREMATDLEVVDEEGRRRPRPSVVDFFEEHPLRARDWLRRRMGRTQRELFLDYEQMHELRRSFVRSVERAIRSRHQNAGHLQDPSNIGTTTDV